MATTAWGSTSLHSITCIQKHQLPHDTQAPRVFFKNYALSFTVIPRSNKATTFPQEQGSFELTLLEYDPLFPKNLRPRQSTPEWLYIDRRRRRQLTTLIHVQHLRKCSRTHRPFRCGENRPSLRSNRRILRNAWMSSSMDARNLNAEPGHIPPLSNLFNNHGWTYTGARADTWGRTNNQPTCLAYNSHTKTRRDYIFIIANIILSITDFLVQDDGTSTVHPQLRVTLTINPTPFRALHFDQVPPITQAPAHLGIGHKTCLHTCRGNQIPQLVEHTHALQTHADNKDTASLWTTVFQIMEHGVLTGSDATGRKGIKRIGSVRRRDKLSLPRLAPAQADATDLVDSPDPKAIDAKQHTDDLHELDFKTKTLYPRTQWPA